MAAAVASPGGAFAAIGASVLLLGAVAVFVPAWADGAAVGTATSTAIPASAPAGATPHPSPAATPVQAPEPSAPSKTDGNADGVSAGGRTDPLAAPSPVVAVVRQVAAPTVHVDTGNQLLFPIVSGTSQPFATISITVDSPSPTPPTTLVAAADGTWQSDPIVALPQGQTSLRITQTDRAGNVSDPALLQFTLGSPVLSVDLSSDGYRVKIAGAPSATVELVGGGVPGVCSRSWAPMGSCGRHPVGRAPGIYDVGVRYRLGDRFGPTAHQSVVFG